ncbi:putative mediator of RNA polymerase II transcription subunit 29 isoform X3 [Lucilia cuprina]|uniref:putative mediator of RNA polymerase II transcription subunit 29 isoform X3 n=1 Tax=Lucilia cuprina TaxID=7375 RepID=UPI001F053EC6|nr:putative mediator of RNA polymerase II transcription subunit 29 isoform X3 [Lucilia cuprina]
MTTSQTEINTNSNNNTTAGSSISNNAGGGNVVNGVERRNSGGGVVTTTTNSNNSSQHNIATISEVGKRKKLKSRNTAATTTALPTTILPSTIGSGNSGYSKDHLDAWLETCLKDASTAQLSSSSEFLDYNPTNNNMMTANAATSAAAAAAMSVNNLNHKNLFSIPSSSSAQQQQPPVLFNMANLNQHQQSQQQQQQQFAMRTNPMNNGSNNMPNNNSFNNLPFSQGFQRNMPNFMKHSTNSFNNRYSMMFPPVGGGYYQQNDGSQDFASLPPMVNIMGGSGGGTSSEHENNSTDVLDGSSSNPNISRGFRFSDPCLLNPSDNDSKLSGQNTPDRRNNLPNDMDQNNKFFNILMEQIQLLHETNTKICRDLHEAKGAYTPGMMTDVVREVKDAARVREDALLNRVKAMVEERQWSMNESNLRMMRDIEELKSQVHHLRVDRKETNKRLNHLEAENKYMRQMLAALYNNRSVPDIIYENETLRTRKSFPHSRRTQPTPMNLHYGTIHHQPATSSLDEQEEEPLHIVETPSTTSTADIASVTAQQRPPSDMRNSFSSSDGGSINGGNITNKIGPIMSPPNFALISSPADEIKRKKEKTIKKLSSDEADNIDSPAVANITPQDLRRELKEAVAARKDADERIIALENLVKTLQVNTSHPPSSKATDNRLQQQQQHQELSNGDGGNINKLVVVSSNSNDGGIGSGSKGEGIKNTKRSTIAATPSVTANSKNNHKWTKHSNHHHQQQQQQKHQYSGTNNTTTTTTSTANLAHNNSPVKLSVAGPITDL